MNTDLPLEEQMISALPDIQVETITEYVTPKMLFFILRFSLFQQHFFFFITSSDRVFFFLLK